MILLQFRDRILGFFDNLRTDAYFRGVKISDISISRMNSWSNRNFSLTDLTTISKVQAKAFDYDRLKRVMNNDDQWNKVADKLSKIQILELKYDESHFKAFSASKVYKLFLNGQISERFAYDHIASINKDNPERRDKIISTGIVFGYIPNDASSLDYYNVLKTQPLERALPIIRGITAEQITPAIANTIISKLNINTLYSLWNLQSSVVDKIWECSTYKITDAQREEVKSHIKQSINNSNLNFLYYLPLNEGFFDTEIMSNLSDFFKINFNQNRIVSTLSTSKIMYLWDYIPKEILPFVTQAQFVKLAVNNAHQLCDRLGPAYYSFLKACSPEAFLSIWKNCPQLHKSIIDNVEIDPELVINDISPKNLYLLGIKYPYLLKKYPDKFNDDYVLEIIDTYRGRLNEIKLSSDQVIYYLENSKNEDTKERLFISFFTKYKSELINFDVALKYLKFVPEDGLKEVADMAGIRERLANNFNGENSAHIYLGTIFNFSPKDFPSTKWHLYCDKMSNNQFEVWINTNPLMTFDNCIDAFTRLQHIERKQLILRGRKIWDLAHDKLIDRADANTRLFFPYVFPLKNWTAEIFKNFTNSFFYNLTFSFEYKLDEADVILNASKMYRDNAISFLLQLSYKVKNSKRLRTCLIEWNKWVLEDFEKQLNSPNTNLMTLTININTLARDNFINPETYKQIQLLIETKNAEKIKAILENPEYISLKKQLSDDSKTINTSSDNVTITEALSAFAQKYAKLKEIIKDLKVVDVELEDLKKEVKLKKIEMDSEEDIFGYFASLHTLNNQKGLTKEVIERNRAILNRAYAADISEIGEIEKVKVLDLGSVIVRDEIGTVDLENSLKRIALAFPGKK